jgi:hypothetical protein
MASQQGTIDATFYAQVVPKFGHTYVQGQGWVPDVDSIRVTTITQSRPNKPAANAVVVKLTVRFNKAAFLPLQPVAVIEIPDVLTQVSQVIEVEADDPTDGGSAAAAEYLAKVARGEL